MRPPTPIRSGADYVEQIPDLRKSNPLDWIVSAGKVVGAAVVLVSAASAANNWIAQRANRAVIAAIEPKLAAISAGALISDEQRVRDRDADRAHAKKFEADINARLTAIQRQIARRQKPAGAAVGSAEAP